jgi:hypothetical protein
MTAGRLFCVLTRMLPAEPIPSLQKNMHREILRWQRALLRSKCVVILHVSVIVITPLRQRL